MVCKIGWKINDMDGGIHAYKYVDGTYLHGWWSLKGKIVESMSLGS